MAENLLNFMTEFIAEVDGGKLPAEELDKRISATRTMLREGKNMTGSQFAEVMTVAHFANYFADALSRMFYKDYQYLSGGWRDYCFIDFAPDFREVKRFRMSEPGTLYLRREKAEAKATDIQECKIDYAVLEYARQFDVSWHAILNDDLGKIKETPSRMAKAAARFEDMFVSALYDNATTQATLAGLGAPWSGTGRLTAANLAIGIAAMHSRTDAAGNPLAIPSVWLVVPPVLQYQAATLIQSELMPGVATNDKNIIPQYIRGVRVDPYIATAVPNVPWYLFADPASIPAVSVLRLQGYDKPWVSKKRSDIEVVIGDAPSPATMGSFATGDIEYMVNDLIGGWDDASYVGVTDFRGIYYSSGTTP